MSTPPAAVAGERGAAPHAPRRRLVGIDVARALALLGMVATHVFPGRGADGELSFAYEVAAGRASALFAVLAGVSLALVTGGRTPLRGRPLLRAGAAVGVRAVAVAVIGLLLGSLDTGVAVILTYYGVLFLLAIPFLRARAPALLVLAAAWTVLGPVVTRGLRGDLPPRGTDSPDLAQLAKPGHLVSELLLTGYYPALMWLVYLLVGLGLGRTDLRSRAVQVRLLVGGAALAVVASVVSGAASRAAGFSESRLDGVATGMFGQTPTDDPRWLLVDAPHSTTPFDLAQTLGSALAVVGLCLLVVSALDGRGERVVAVLLGAGTMTLTLYTLHLLVLAVDLPPGEGLGTYAAHVVLLVGIGAAFAARRTRGPLELLVGALPRRVVAR